MRFLKYLKYKNSEKMRVKVRKNIQQANIKTKKSWWWDWLNTHQFCFPF